MVPTTQQITHSTAIEINHHTSATDHLASHPCHDSAEQLAHTDTTDCCKTVACQECLSCWPATMVSMAEIAHCIAGRIITTMPITNESLRQHPLIRPPIA